LRLLLDAHTLLWAAWDHPNLSSAAKDLIRDRANELWLSDGTLWELAIKISLRKLTITEPLNVFLDRLIMEYDIRSLHISVEHCARLTTLPHHHRDPFDRLLVAQGLVEQISILSGDAVMDAYGISRVW
jgi:PIN domain nuclease of toxin-antitoxin system